MQRLLSNTRHLWNVWRSIVRTSLVREMAFRGNFTIGLVRQISWVLAFVVVVDIIFRNTNSLAGWTQAEVLLIISLSRIFEGIADVVFTRNIISGIPDSINDGKLDFTLTKPIPSQFYAAFHRIHIMNTGNVIAGLLLMVYVLTKLGLPSLAATTAFVAIALIGLIIRYAILLAVVSFAFVLERFNAMWAFDQMLTEPLTYPFDIFPRSVRIPLTYLIPLAFVVFVPAQALTGRLQLWQVPTAIAIAAIFLTLANLAWRAGLRRYSSASS